MQAPELQPLLATALQRHLAQAGEVEALTRLTGGATKQTWSFVWTRAGHREPMILQQTGPATAAPLRHARGGPSKLLGSEEAALMTLAREHGVPAPRVRLTLRAEDGLGAGYVTERVEGETLGKRVVHDEALATARRVLARQCGQTLAAIHRLPTAGVDFLSPLSPNEELQAYGAMVSQFSESHPALAYALRWVHEHLPARWTPALVHADFRTGNLIVGPEGLRCVLDWEIARIGDPMQDLGVLCMRTWRFGGTPAVGGFGTRDDLYAAYEASSGQSVDPARVRFWEAFSNLKWAIACVRRGQARRDDGRPASVELCAVGRRLEEPLWDFFEGIAA